mmetsp:Transcript_100407/g.290002  ORF Transcript_100407/g.290002 Transcript_100407/m.290002 type:complete len:229 (-) Transcript_100407:137-823(-)
MSTVPSFSRLGHVVRQGGVACGRVRRPQARHLPRRPLGVVEDEGRALRHVQDLSRDGRHLPHGLLPHLLGGLRWMLCGRLRLPAGLAPGLQDDVAPIREEFEQDVILQGVHDEGQRRRHQAPDPENRRGGHVGWNVEHPNTEHGDVPPDVAIPQQKDHIAKEGQAQCEDDHPVPSGRKEGHSVVHRDDQPCVHAGAEGEVITGAIPGEVRQRIDDHEQDGARVHECGQ